MFYTLWKIFCYSHDKIPNVEVLEFLCEHHTSLMGLSTYFRTPLQFWKPDFFFLMGRKIQEENTAIGMEQLISPFPK